MPIALIAHTGFVRQPGTPTHNNLSCHAQISRLLTLPHVTMSLEPLHEKVSELVLRHLSQDSKTTTSDYQRDKDKLMASCEPRDREHAASLISKEEEAVSRQGRERAEIVFNWCREAFDRLDFSDPSFLLPVAELLQSHIGFSSFAACDKVDHLLSLGLHIFLRRVVIHLEAESETTRQRHHGMQYGLAITVALCCVVCQKTGFDPVNYLKRMRNFLRRQATW